MVNIKGLSHIETKELIGEVKKFKDVKEEFYMVSKDKKKKEDEDELEDDEDWEDDDEDWEDDDEDDDEDW